ncbi:hypothetical protein FOA52_015616 [Chlamydomonas sp. UWO 241]|nr:hypothetical protein FOA52_015616 [Chlamydomonas sp. UWO 241]
MCGLWVARPEEQHKVMQEAVENHMPQAIIIDEIGTEAECQAARTISQRGVQLVATAHGNSLENVIKNPALNLLVGGIQSVTLGDEAAKLRGVQKSILERAAPPTFDVCVEMVDRHRWRVHTDVGASVDSILAGGEAPTLLRERDAATGAVRDIAFKGVVRRADPETGEVVPMEWWSASDGEEIVRPVGQPGFNTVPTQSGAGALPVPSTMSATATTTSSAAAAAAPAAASPATARPLFAAAASARSVAAERPAGSSSGPTGAQAPGPSPAPRRPLPTMLEVPPAPAPPAASGAAAPAASPAAPPAAPPADRADKPPPQLWPGDAPAARADAPPPQPALWRSLAASAAAPPAASASPSAPARAGEAPMWPSLAAAAASRPAVMPTPELDSGAVIQAVTGTRASGSQALKVMDEAAAAAGARPTPAAAAAPAPDAPPSPQPPQAEWAGGSQATAAALEGAQQAPPQQQQPPAMRVHLFMDDDSACKVSSALAALAGASTVEVTSELSQAQVIVATRTALRASPRIKSDARRLSVPIYALRSTSAASVARDLCPLLGIVPSSSAVAAAAAAAAAAAGYDSPSSSATSSLDSLDEMVAVGGVAVAGDGGGGSRLDDVSCADDVAALLQSMVRELRYAPIDREYAQSALDDFLREAAAGGCNAASLATMAWALSHTKHKRKFVDARREQLLVLAGEAGARWGELSPSDLLRLATGYSGLRLTPGLEWVEELVLRCNAGVAAGSYLPQQVERLTAALYNLEVLAEMDAEAQRRAHVLVEMGAEA